MRYRSTLLSVLVLFGLGSIVPPAVGQVAVPRTLTLETEVLEKTGEVLLKEALYLTQFQQFPAALARSKVATQLVPKSADAWALRGALHLRLDQVEQGVQALETARELDGQNPGIFFSLGSAYFSQGSYSQAATALETGLKIKPDQTEPLFDLGNSYYKLGKFDLAIANYQKSMGQDEKFWPAINNIGLVHYEAGDIPSAINSWEAAIAIDGTSGEPHLALAVALYTQGQTDQGLTLAQKALELDSRYGKVEFLKENLWGDRLIQNTRQVLNNPKIQNILAQLTDGIEDN